MSDDRTDTPGDDRGHRPSGEQDDERDGERQGDGEGGGEGGGGGEPAVAATADRLAELLEATGSTIGVVESLTGGLLVQALARIRGSGAWLRGGIVAYDRQVKHDLLGVTAEKVVSEQAAAEMAAAARRLLGADIGIAVTGVGGPDRQDGEPPGTVWIAVDDRDRPTTAKLDLDGDPKAICDGAVAEVLDLAARHC